MTCVPLATTRVTTTEPLRDAMSAVELTSPSPIFAARTRNDITIHARQTACPEAMSEDSRERARSALTRWRAANTRIDYAPPSSTPNSVSG